jgi:hypothetical protein
MARIQAELNGQNGLRSMAGPVAHPSWWLGGGLVASRPLSQRRYRCAEGSADRFCGCLFMGWASSFPWFEYHLNRSKHARDP